MSYTPADKKLAAHEIAMTDFPEGKVNLITDNDNGGQKSNFQKYAESTSVGGLTFVLTGSSKIRRLLWLIILVCCIAASFYLLRNSVTKLITRPTATSITKEPNLSLDYPAITICNLNWFSLSYTTILGGDAAVNTLRQHLISGNCQAPYPATFPASSVPIGSLVDQIKQRFIVTCLINGIQCNETDIDITISQNTICYTFNSGKNGKPLIKANAAGPPGLDLVVDIREYDYVYTYKSEVGVTVTIHPQDEIPLAGERGILVAPGTGTQITFRKRILDDKTATNCGEEPWASCIEGLLYEDLRNNCRCFADVHDLDSVEEALNVCPITDLCCYYIHPNITRRISSTCLPQCRSTEYEIVASSSAKFPASYFTSNSDVYEYFQSNYISLEIFFQTLNVETQTTSFTYGPEEFLAEVGGQLGLCIGVSVISLFEIIVFILDEIKDRCCKPLCGSKKKRKDVSVI